MEPNIAAAISKKLWKMVKVAIYMIKRGLGKGKIFMDLNMMMKRGKIAGKTLKNLMFHNHHHHNINHIFASRVGVGGPSNLPNDGPREYEFSCSNTPLYRHYFTNKRKNNHQNNNLINTNSQYYLPSPYNPLEDDENNVDLDQVNDVLEMMLRNDEGTNNVGSCYASPALPGLGFSQSPAIRQLRITDSPFPVQNSDENKHVDEAAEDFIKKFYTQLKQQKLY